MLLTINPENPQPRLIAQVVDVIRQGGVICYPTDTVYGIGCDIFNQKAVKRVHQIKRRPPHKPCSFMCHSLKEVSDYCHISNTAYRLMRRNLPGAYTFVLPAMKIVPKIMLAKQKTAGIRVPDNKISLALIEALGNPILNTSAILDEDEEPLSQAFAIEERLGGLVDLVIDGGPVYPAPSSLLSLVGDTVEVLREGKGDVSRFF